MEFRLLGPLEIVTAGRPVPLGGGRARAVLGLLLLHANEVVATSALLRVLWPDEVPSTARKMLQNAVSGLRGALAVDEGSGAAPLLVTHAPGYLLRVDPADLDLYRFTALADRGRAEAAAGALPQAAASLRAALALWRGPALADLAETGAAWPELTAVNERRLAAMEDLYEVELAAGRHRDIVHDLELLADTQPSRERLCGRLMLALYRDGRQVEALAAYRRTRDALVAELGLEPSRELQELERAILVQDHALDLDRPSDVDSSPGGTPGAVAGRAGTPALPAGPAAVPGVAVPPGVLSREDQLLAEIESLKAALGEAHVELRLWKRSAARQLGFPLPDRVGAVPAVG